jgi:ABC-type transport system involved in cytochrome bd biosynthesis fused ATPase/permease subunit
MFSKIFVLLAIVGAAVAFTPAKVTMPSRVVARAAPTMSFKSDCAKAIAVASAMVPMAAHATEGTNEILGIDTPIIVLVALPVLAVVNAVYNDWAKNQDNDEFFDGLPPTPK